MRLRLWPFVSLSFAVILTLMVLLAWSVARKALQIDERAGDAHRIYQQADDAVTNIRADVYRAALLAGNIPVTSRSPRLEKQLNDLRASSTAEAQRLSALLGARQIAKLGPLERELDVYWRTLAIPAPDASISPLLENAGKQPDTVLTMAEQIDTLNEASIHQQEREIFAQRRTLREFAMKATALMLGLSVAVALFSIYGLARLERLSSNEKSRAEQAEFELRRLSQQLVRAQEEERKTISRELHDEVGQVLTGLRLEVGTLANSRLNDTFFERVESIKGLAEEALRTVRNLALLLRPSMLDDLGLGAALRWQAKEFSRRIGVPIIVELEGNLDGLGESQSICLYRVVQEALTNSARHADPKRVTVTIHQDENLVTAVIWDNGKGFDAKNRHNAGLGLAGMDERVRALHGTLSISSQPGQGTELKIALPLQLRPMCEVGSL